MEWYTMRKERINLKEELKEFLGREDIILHIGTDAQKNGTINRADFVTVVCVISTINAKTRKVFAWKDKHIPTHSLWEKLYGETERSLRVAVDLDTHFDGALRNNIMVHVDANPDKRYASSNHVKTLAGMVVGYGFKHVLKPDAWAASHAADHIVKNKNHG